MRRRTLLRLAAAAFAAPTAVFAQSPVAPPGAGVTPPAPRPSDLLGASGEGYFIDWLNDFYARALASGVSRTLLDQALSGASPDPRVMAHDTAQPEFARPVGDYIRASVTSGRITQGRGLRDSISQFAAIEQTYGCPRDVLLGVWAMESNFGRSQGDMDVVRSLATLAALGRRRPWAEGELLAALQILGSGRAPGPRLLGSWAGAMGQTQMVPSTYLADGVDGDGDGRVDIWNSAPDALASAANLLAKGGWRRGEGWAREVLLAPGFDISLVEGPEQTPDWWAQKGAHRADGLPWVGSDVAAPCVLLLPSGSHGPAFLALPNHFVIRKYNNSLAYALAVGMLADGFSGGPPLTTAWPHETPLSLDDRLAAQGALQRLGFDPGPLDGVIGARARAALRAWQKAQGLTADGYLTPDLIARLKAAAA
ncbi:MAG: peptidoglycan-binding protein [Caulobacteraceae bacterium]|nr:peptidoglycan-binding protein [Caulobacteraceae bacterium]